MKSLIISGFVALLLGIIAAILLHGSEVQAKVNDRSLFEYVLEQNTAARQWLVGVPFAVKIEYAIEHHTDVYLDRELRDVSVVTPSQADYIAALQDADGHILFGTGSVICDGDYRKEIFEVSSSASELTRRIVRLLNPTYAVVKMDSQLNLYKSTDAAIDISGRYKGRGYAGLGESLANMHKPYDLRHVGFGFLNNYWDEQVAAYPNIRWGIKEELTDTGESIYHVERYYGSNDHADMTFVVDPKKGFLITQVQAFGQDQELDVEITISPALLGEGRWYPADVTIKRAEKTLYSSVKDFELLGEVAHEEEFTIESLSSELRDDLPVVVHEADGSEWRARLNDGELVPEEPENAV